MKTKQMYEEESLIGSYRNSWDWHQSAAFEWPTNSIA